MSGKTVVIVNPIAHNLPSRRQLDSVDEWLRLRGWQVSWEETTARGHAIEIASRAADQGLPLIFVCGGDGTLAEAANGLAGSETALAAIPAGTVNIWARETGTPRRPLAAVQAILSGERRKVDLGKAGGRHFLLMAGYGLDGEITHRVSMRSKRYVGATAYALTAARESLRYKGQAITVTIDGERIRANTLMLLASNTRNYAGLVQIAPAAFADDGLLDVCLFLGKGVIDAAVHAVLVALRRHMKSRKVIYRRASRVEIEWDEPLPLHLDGDACPESPSLLGIAPLALAVMTPGHIRPPIFSR